MKLDLFLKQNKLPVFSKVILSNDVESGLTYLIQGSGLGGLNPNTVMLSWPHEWEHDESKINRFVHVINNATTYGHVITVLKPESAFDDDNKHSGTIDIWSFNYAKGMLFLLAHLLKRSSRSWKSCKPRLFVVTTLESEQEQKDLAKIVKDMLSKYRLLPEIQIQVVKISTDLNLPFANQMKEKQDEERVIEEVEQDRTFQPEKIENLRKLSYYQNIEQ